MNACKPESTGDRVGIDEFGADAAPTDWEATGGDEREEEGAKLGDLAGRNEGERANMAGECPIEADFEKLRASISGDAAGPAFLELGNSGDFFRFGATAHTGALSDSSTMLKKHFDRSMDCRLTTCPFSVNSGRLP